MKTHGSELNKSKSLWTSRRKIQFHGHLGFPGMANLSHRGRITVQSVGMWHSAVSFRTHWCSTVWKQVWLFLAQMQKFYAGSKKSRSGLATGLTWPTNCGWCATSCTACLNYSMSRSTLTLNQSRATGMVPEHTQISLADHLATIKTVQISKISSKVWENATRNVLYSTALKIKKD